MTAPFHIIDGDPKSGLFVFGDHASNFIPEHYNSLGLGEEDLTRHIAWDIGTEGLIRGICANLRAPGLLAGFSRLLIDSNRPSNFDTAIPEFSDGTEIPGNQDVSEEARQLRIDTYYTPYHEQLSSALNALDTPLVLSVHSFTPKPHEGAERTLDIGLLVKYDVQTAERFADALATLAPHLSVAMNEPYSAHDLNHTIDEHVAPRALPHLAIEIRQDHLDTDWGVTKMVTLVTDVLKKVMT